MELYGYDVGNDYDMQVDYKDIREYYLEKHGAAPSDRCIVALALDALARECREQERIWDYTERPESCKRENE